MILRHDNVEPPGAGLHEDGIARPRPAGVDALGPCGLDSGPDDAYFFVAEQAAFPGMGIEAGDRYPRRHETQRLATLMGEADCGHKMWSDRHAERAEMVPKPLHVS